MRLSGERMETKSGGAKMPERVLRIGVDNYPASSVHGRGQRKRPAKPPNKSASRAHGIAIADPYVYGGLIAMSENTTTAETVARTLASHPDGITVRDLATEAGVGQSTAAKTLAAMETAGTATRTPGPANGNRKGADIWRPVADDATATPDEAPVADDATATPDEATVADDATATPDEAPVADDATATPDEAPVADDATATPDEAPVADDATVTPDEASVADDATAAPDEAPVAAAPRQPDLKVLIMAGVLGDHPDGVEATVAIAESGLAPATGDTILAAMEVAGAARRLPVGENGVELWVRGDGDLATVDPANAPTHTTCPTCGHTRRIRRPSATGRRSGGTGRVTGEINSDGSVKLAKGELERLVEAFIRDVGPGHELTPVTVGRELGGRSSGACGNAMDKLTARGVLVLTSEAPRKFALADDAPPPSAEVLAHMTSHRPATADDAAADDSDEGTADEARAA
jgi:hypothetical protein